MGIRFYSGFPELQPMLHVSLWREPSNIVDSNAILVIGKILGHIEKEVAAVYLICQNFLLKGMK